MRQREEFVPKKRSRFLEGNETVDSKDYERISRFLTDYGKIVPARLTGASAKQQRQIKRAVRRARNVNILP